MFSSIKNIASAGASPIAAKVMLYVIAGLIILALGVGGTLTWKLYQSQQEITTLTEQNVQLQSNISTLKGNIVTLQSTVEAKNEEIEKQKKRYKDLLEEYALLTADAEEIQKKAREYEDTLRELKEELDSESSKYLNTRVPDSVIDTINDRMFNSKESSGDS